MDQKRIAENLAAVEAHFHSEAENEVMAALRLYTDDIVWEAPALNGLDRAYSGREAVAENYRQLWASMRDVKFTFLQRFATDDRVADDSLVTFEVIRDAVCAVVVHGIRPCGAWQPRRRVCLVAPRQVFQLPEVTTSVGVPAHQGEEMRQQHHTCRLAA